MPRKSDKKPAARTSKTRVRLARRDGQTVGLLDRPDPTKRPKSTKLTKRNSRSAALRPVRRSGRTSPGKDRRAFSTARAPGRSEQGGDTELSQKLARALRAAQSDNQVNPLHAYPARMHPATARSLVELTLGLAGPGPLVLLDPFCGSGTTLIEGCRQGARTLGVDANPLAVLIATAQTWIAPSKRYAELRKLGHSITSAVLATGKAARRASHEPAPLRAPAGVDPERRNRLLADWFAPHVRRELEAIAAQIDEVQQRDAELANFLTVALSAILYKVSYRASDTDSSRLSRRVARGHAARLFGQRIDQLISGLGDLAGAPPSTVHCGDARHLADVGVADSSIDAIVTSPPYPGTYDYAEQHRLRLDFLAIPTDQLGQREIGARRHFAGQGAPPRRARRRFTRSLTAALTEIARVLRPGGRAAVMLGDSIAGGRVMWADETIATAIERVESRTDGAPGHGSAISIEVEAWAWHSRPTLGREEYRLFGDRPKRECIFLLRKSVSLTNLSRPPRKTKPW
ncbi:MAG: hypothetical protein MJE77_43605 [Proteobacteria bacterium]|nr:hypothetical protein [Pseudomonadota bacterium]